MKWFFFLLLCFCVSACVATGGNLQPEVYSPTAIDGRYAETLAQEYQRTATLLSVNGEKALAARFEAKSLKAWAGVWDYPDVPGARATADIEKTYQGLGTALMTSMNADNAQWLARAQVNYDCWAAESPSLKDGCRRDTQKALRSVTIPEHAFRPYVIYFDAESAIVGAEAEKTLESLAMRARMDKTFEIHLAGITEESEKNPSLALRRAISVRNALSQFGANPDRIIVKDENISDRILGQQSPESGNRPKSRRVDILLKPMFGEDA